MDAGGARSRARKVCARRAAPPAPPMASATRGCTGGTQSAGESATCTTERRARCAPMTPS
eukprot:6299888-Pyramimonas_sp.AAC.1